MEQTSTHTKPRIIINPPPRDLHCMRCGRAFNELPQYPHVIDKDDKESCFRGNVVLDSDGKARLMKTFRGNICIGASWECMDCLHCSDMSDLVGEYMDEYNEPSQEDVKRYEEAVAQVKDLALKAIAEGLLYFDTPVGRFCTKELQRCYPEMLTKKER